MADEQTGKLYDKGVAVDFYDARYATGYLEEWPADRKARITELIRSARLPSSGEALDFGCGNGVLTEVVRGALPEGWTICGTDLSAVAIDHAGVRYPRCRFFVSSDDRVRGKRYDFLFTHHVLEHVYDLAAILAEVNALLKPRATVMHILPCGNHGSLEHGVCLLRKDGINPRLENRFFFEDEGHVRRLSTAQLATLLERDGLHLSAAYYANHYDGAINWITKSSGEFLARFTDSSAAVDEPAARQLRQWRARLFLRWAFRYPATLVDRILPRRQRSLRHWLLLALALPFCAIARPVDRYLERRARREWDSRKLDPGGSEMYLVFRRS